MIFRLSQKLAKKLKAGTLSSLPPDENSYADWSANLFTADRTQYILLTNTQSLYSVVMYPLCVEGERACPPEDVGGAWGYADFLEALADPEHEQHDDYLEWAGPFDAEEFSAEKATKAMRRGLPDWRQYE